MEYFKKCLLCLFFRNMLKEKNQLLIFFFLLLPKEQITIYMWKEKWSFGLVSISIEFWTTKCRSFFALHVSPFNCSRTKRRFFKGFRVSISGIGWSVVEISKVAHKCFFFISRTCNRTKITSYSELGVVATSEFFKFIFGAQHHKFVFLFLQNPFPILFQFWCRRWNFAIIFIFRKGWQKRIVGYLFSLPPKKRPS